MTQTRDDGMQYTRSLEELIMSAGLALPDPQQDCLEPPSAHAARVEAYRADYSARSSEDYRVYAIRQLTMALLKEHDSSFASAEMHEVAARLALDMEGIPRTTELMDELVQTKPMFVRRSGLDLIERMLPSVVALPVE